MKPNVYQTIIVITAAAVMALLYFVVSPLRHEYVTYAPKINQVADRDIIAPFSFPIFKDEAQLSQERVLAASQVETVWYISPNRNNSIFKNLDAFFSELLKLYGNEQDDVNIRDFFRKHKGFSLSRESISFLRDFDNLNRLQARLSEEVRRLVEEGVYDDALIDGEQLQLMRDGEIVDVPLHELNTESGAKRIIARRLSYGAPGTIVEDILGPITLVNIEPENEVTEMLRQDARDRVEPTLGTVESNEKIIEKNTRVTPMQFRRLQSMHIAERQLGFSTFTDRQILFSTLGVFLFLLIVLGMLMILMNFYFAPQFRSVVRSVLLVLPIVFTALATVLVHDVFSLHVLLIPVLFAPLFVAMIFELRVGIVFNFFNFVVAALFLNWDFLSPLQMTLAILIALLLLLRMGDRGAPVQMLLVVLFPFLASLAAVNLIKLESFPIYANGMFWGGLSILISVVLVATLTPFVKRRLKMATRQILLDLLDFNSPLLKRLAASAPGTYSHSLLVGNLAESAAGAIGANPLLARVGGYYHDIGKIEGSEIFTENNPDSSNIHDELTPEESALRIRDHVSRGLSYARRHRLPQAVIDIIAQHHGNSQIRFFLDKAQKEGKPFDIGKFQYFGPRPQTKEAALVMIADIVESTIKSLKQPDEEAIRKTLNETVLRLIREGQIVEVPITLRELETMKSYMLPILKGVYNQRIEYPEPEGDD
ncbi:MAG: HDIG domain-containing protein [Candidatus Cloacimonetes bacterium]|nr:HDIG domain-containing protein [Candidatus Cloacimonadota bacterium]